MPISKSVEQRKREKKDKTSRNTGYKQKHIEIKQSMRKFVAVVTKPVSDERRSPKTLF